MLRNPGKDITTIEFDLKLSTLKPRHGKLMKEVYEWLLTDKGKGIILLLEMARFCQVTPTFRILRTVVSSTWLSFVQF